MARNPSPNPRPPVPDPKPGLIRFPRKRPRRDTFFVHLFRRGLVYWVHFTLHGRQVRKTLGTRDRRIAEDLRAQMEHELRSKRFRLPANPTVEQFLEGYFPEIRVRLRPRVCSQSERHIREFFEEVGVKKLADVSAGDLGKYLAGRRRSGWGPKTANNVRAILHAMFEHARRRNEIVQNPVIDVPPYRVTQRTPRFLSLEQIFELFEILDGDIVEPIVATILYAGLRRTESIWLTRKDVDLRRRVIQVRSKEVDGELWEVKTGQDRGVPIAPKLMPFLTEQRASVESRTWFFLSPEGCRWDPDNLTHRFRRILKAAGRPWTLLDLRHTFGSQLAMKNLSLYKISKAMGNSPEICRRHYAALSPEELGDEIAF